MRHHIWLLAAIGLVGIGTIGSVLGARAIARTDGQRSRQAFVTSSMDIASTLKLAIQHEQDLVTPAGAFAVRNPNATQADFLQWTNSVRAFQRYPEVIGIAELAMVPASQLSAFAARAVVDPTGPLAADGTFQVTPAGNRPYYCLATATVSRTTSTTPAGLDFCDTELGAPLLRARDSGEDAYVPYGTGKNAELVWGTPVYRDGFVPGTIQARRDAFIGWTGTSTVPNVILATALAHHPSTAVAFGYHSSSSAVTFKAGSAPAGAQFTTIDLNNGWHVQVFGAMTGGGVFANPNSLILLVGGIVVSLSLGVQLYVLGTSRSRALQLVRERTNELHHQAFHDSLTGLPNRALILDRAGQMLARSRRDRSPVAAFFIDLDDFKDINDTLGHKAGDQLLVGVGTRLDSALRQGDTVGRLGGDEFVVLAGGASLKAGGEVLAGRILDVLSGPFEISDSDVPLAVTASIGIAEGDRATPGELLRDADIALYQAKAAGKHCAVLFSSAMQESVDDHRHLEVDLHDALEDGQFFLLYQPTVDLATGDITGVEALIRWQHPQRGIVLPDEFIPALESSGLIVPVGQWVLEAACRQGAAWQNMGHRITVSVNVSAVQLERDRIVDEVHMALGASGFEPARLILELTETALMRDVQASLVRLNRLKAIGVGVAIDDFGTGYSSLAYLRQFPIDELKIDQSFVAGIADSSESAAIIHTLVQLGKVLELKTIAEGIENHDQLERLRAEHVDIGQGFLFARPLDEEGISRLLNTAAGKFKDLRVLS
ncbi:MAG: EAL domain-containing protein [Acidimicrobiales bacterium]|nr:EAL domain-containing protein [Acidimicrobiales bacterium]